MVAAREGGKGGGKEGEEWREGRGRDGCRKGGVEEVTHMFTPWAVGGEGILHHFFAVRDEDLLTLVLEVVTWSEQRTRIRGEMVIPAEEQSLLSHVNSV